MEINELSTSTFTVRPLNESGTAFTPTNARYRLDDVTTGNNVIDWTEIGTPSTEMEIIIPASSHTILDTNREHEEKILTVQTDFGTDNQHVEEFIYELRNLSFVS